MHVCLTKARQSNRRTYSGIHLNNAHGVARAWADWRRDEGITDGLHQPHPAVHWCARFTHLAEEDGVDLGQGKQPRAGPSFFSSQETTTWRDTLRVIPAIAKATVTASLPMRTPTAAGVAANAVLPKLSPDRKTWIAEGRHPYAWYRRRVAPDHRNPDNLGMVSATIRAGTLPFGGIRIPWRQDVGIDSPGGTVAKAMLAGIGRSEGEGVWATIAPAAPMRRLLKASGE